MAIQHKHIIIRAKVNNPPKDVEVTKSWLAGFVEKIGMKRLIDPVAVYVNSEGNEGMTACVLIETSHIAFHVWDAENPALLQFDLYTCGELDVQQVLDEANAFFAFATAEYTVLDRENRIERII